MLDEFKSRFLQPVKPWWRWLNLILLVIAAIGCVWSYVLINHIICTENTCEVLKITRIWVTLSPIFIGYGALLLVAARFFHNEKELASIFFDALIVLLLLGAMIICLLPFGVMAEANVHT